MNYLKVSEASLKQAAEILRDGGLVAFPTETVYGLGGDVFNPLALAKIFEVKNRPSFDPLIIHISGIETLERVADLSLLSKETHRKLFLLAENLWPGPLSIVLPKNKGIPDITTAGLDTAAIRFPDHETARELISLSTGAVAAPSANPFGSLSPTRAEHVRDKLGSKVDLILDGGSTRFGLESTVLDITGKDIKILRPGGTPKEDIEKLIGQVQTINNKEQITNIEHQPQISPGMLKSHYAPKTPLSAFEKEELIKQSYKPGCAFLFFDGLTRDSWEKLHKPPETAFIRVLSQAGQSLEAASRLFETLHELDNCNLQHIFAQFAPWQGLGEAINDRLTRAQYR